jgi:hypothetical protein
MTIATATIRGISGSSKQNGVLGQMVTFTDGTQAFVPGARPSYNSTFASLEPRIASAAVPPPPAQATVTTYDPVTGATTSKQYQTTDKTRSDWVSADDLAFLQQQATDSKAIYDRNQAAAKQQADALAQQQIQNQAVAQQQAEAAAAKQAQEAALAQQQAQAQAAYEAQLAAAAKQQADAMAAEQAQRQVVAQQQAEAAAARQEQEAALAQQQAAKQAEYQAALDASAAEQKTALAAEQTVNARRATANDLAYYKKQAEVYPGAPQPVASVKDLGSVTKSSMPQIDASTGITYFPTADGWKQYKDSKAADYVAQNQLMMKLPEIAGTSKPFTSPSGKIYYPLIPTYTETNDGRRFPLQVDSGWIQESDPNGQGYTPGASSIYAGNQRQVSYNQISYVDPADQLPNLFNGQSGYPNGATIQITNPYGANYVSPGAYGARQQEIERQRISDQQWANSQPKGLFQGGGGEALADFDKLINNTIGWKTIATIAGSVVGGPLGATFANAAAGAIAGDSLEDIAKSAALTFALTYGTQALGEALNQTVATGVDLGLVDADVGGSFLEGSTEIIPTESVAPDFGGSEFIPEAPVAPQPPPTTVPGTEYTGGQDLSNFYDTTPIEAPVVPSEVAPIPGAPVAGTPETYGFSQEELNAMYEGYNAPVQPGGQVAGPGTGIPQGTVTVDQGISSPETVFGGGEAPPPGYLGDIKDLTPTDLSNLTPTEVASLTTEQLSTLNPEQLSNIPTGGLTPGELTTLAAIGVPAAVIAIAASGGGGAPAAVVPPPAPPAPVAPPATTPPVTTPPVTTPPVTTPPVVEPVPPGTTPPVTTPPVTTPPVVEPVPPGTTPPTTTPPGTPGPVPPTTTPPGTTPGPVPPSSEVVPPGTTPTPPTVTPPTTPGGPNTIDYSKPYEGQYSDQSVLERYMSKTISYGDILTLIAAGMVAPTVLSMLGVAPGQPGAPGTPGYGPLPPIEWGSATPLAQGGLNPGYLTFGGQPPAYYQTNNPVQSQYYWGRHPYMAGPEDLANYNNIPGAPAVPFGRQQPRGAWDYQQFINETIGTPQYQQAAMGASTQYPGGIAPATSYTGAAMTPVAPAPQQQQFTVPVPTAQPMSAPPQQYNMPAVPGPNSTQVNMAFMPTMVPAIGNLPAWEFNGTAPVAPIAPYQITTADGTTPVPVKA